MSSLYAKLLKSIISFFLVLWILVVFLTRGEILHEIEEVFDAQLSQEAGIIFDGVMHTLHTYQIHNYKNTTRVIEKNNEGHKYQNKISFQLWQGKDLLIRSESAPIVKLSATSGYIDKFLDGKLWRIFSTHKKINNQSYTIITAEEYGIRYELINEILIRTISPLLLALPILIVLLHFAIKKALNPLQEIAKLVESRDATDFLPIKIETSPSEITPLIQALNQLIFRLKDAFAKEKRFTTNAAHELRTPITAIQLQAQIARQSLDNPSLLNESLDNILLGTNKSSHLINQMLTLARLNPEAIRKQFVLQNIAQTIEEAVSDNIVLALDKNIEISFQCTPPQGFNVLHDKEGFTILVNNLLQNAIRYCDKNSMINISLLCQQDTYQLIVSDNGPGIAESELDKVLERYYRATNQQNDGCGLGLSIVKQIVDIHEGDIKLSSNRGLTVQLIFHVKPISIQ